MDPVAVGNQVVPGIKREKTVEEIIRELNDPEKTLMSTAQKLSLQDAILTEGMAGKGEVTKVSVDVFANQQAMQQHQAMQQQQGLQQQQSMQQQMFGVLPEAQNIHTYQNGAPSYGVMPGGQGRDTYNQESSFGKLPPRNEQGAHPFGSFG